MSGAPRIAYAVSKSSKPNGAAHTHRRQKRKVLFHCSRATSLGGCFWWSNFIMVGKHNCINVDISRTSRPIPPPFGGPFALPACPLSNNVIFVGISLKRACIRNLKFCQAAQLDCSKETTGEWHSVVMIGFARDAPSVWVMLVVVSFSQMIYMRHRYRLTDENLSQFRARKATLSFSSRAFFSRARPYFVGSLAFVTWRRTKKKLLIIIWHAHRPPAPVIFSHRSGWSSTQCRCHRCYVIYFVSLSEVPEDYWPDSIHECQHHWR